MSEFPDLGRRYQPLSWLARRSHGSSLAVLDHWTGRSVFLKILADDRKHDLRSVERFLLESAVLRRLAEHQPCPVVPLLDTGHIDGRPYFTSPLMPGWTLAEAMRNRPVFQPRSVLRLIELALVRLRDIQALPKGTQLNLRIELRPNTVRLTIC